MSPLCLRSDLKKICSFDKVLDVQNYITVVPPSTTPRHKPSLNGSIHIPAVNSKHVTSRGDEWNPGIIVRTCLWNPSRWDAPLTYINVLHPVSDVM
jgi:hypothetical protein